MKFRGRRLDGTVSRGEDAATCRPALASWFDPGFHAKFAARRRRLCHGRVDNCRAGSIRKSFRLKRRATMRQGKILPRAFRHSLRLVVHIVANSRDARDTVRDYSSRKISVTIIHRPRGFAETCENRLRRVMTPPQPRHVRARTVPPPPREFCIGRSSDRKRDAELIEIVDGLPKDLDWRWGWRRGPTRGMGATRAIRDLNARAFWVSANPSHGSPASGCHASSSEAISNFDRSQARVPAVAYDTQGISEGSFPPDGWAIPPAIARLPGCSFSVQPVGQSRRALTPRPGSTRAKTRPQRQVYHRDIFQLK